MLCCLHCLHIPRGKESDVSKVWTVFFGGGLFFVVVCRVCFPLPPFASFLGDWGLPAPSARGEHCCFGGLSSRSIFCGNLRF